MRGLQRKDKSKPRPRQGVELGSVEMPSNDLCCRSRFPELHKVVVRLLSTFRVNKSPVKAVTPVASERRRQAWWGEKLGINQPLKAAYKSLQQSSLPKISPPMSFGCDTPLPFNAPGLVPRPIPILEHGTHLPTPHVGKTLPRSSILVSTTSASFPVTLPHGLM
jgi:hypothetical protein